MHLTIGRKLLMPIVCIELLFRRRPSIGIVVLPRYMQEKSISRLILSLVM